MDNHNSPDLIDMHRKVAEFVRLSELGLIRASKAIASGVQKSGRGSARGTEE